jgi:flagellar motor switch/type III secretory pathway protein FliN
MPGRQRELLQTAKAELRSSVQSIRKAVWYVQGKKTIPPEELCKLAVIEIIKATKHLNTAMEIFLNEHGELHNG